MKKLPINNPPILGRLHITYPLIPILNHPDGISYIYNHFINVECIKDRNRNDLNYCFLSQLSRNDSSWIFYLLDYYRNKNFALQGDLVEQLLKKIDEGWYVYIHFDDFYLKGKANYNKNHFLHVNFIYGYDIQKAEFLTVGYNYRGIYTKMNITFEEANQGYYFYDSDGVEFMKTALNKKYKFDNKRLILQLLDYVNSENNLTSIDDFEFYGINKNDYIYGVCTYDNLIYNLKEVKNGHFYYDNRNMYVLWEHKSLMVDRICFLINKFGYGFLEEQKQNYFEIMEQSTIIKNLMHKWSITREELLVNKAIDLLKSLQEKEISSLNTIIEKLCTI